MKNNNYFYKILHFIEHPHYPYILDRILSKLSPCISSKIKHGFKNPNTTKYWNNVYKSEIESGIYRDEQYEALHDVIISHIKTGDNVLDVGCGTGSLIKKIMNTYSINPYACDFSEIAINEVEKYCVDAKVICLPDLPSEWDGMFDVITCTEVLDHLSSPNESITRMKKCLNDHGMLIISVPVEENELYHEHVQKYTYYKLDKLLKKHFNDITIKAINEKEHNSYLIGIAKI